MRGMPGHNFALLDYVIGIHIRIRVVSGCRSRVGSTDTRVPAKIFAIAQLLLIVSVVLFG